MAIVYFEVEPERLKETEEFVEKRGGKLYHSSKVPVTLATQSDEALETILSDLGFTHEDLEDGRVERYKTGEERLLEELNADDPDNEVSYMQARLLAISQKLGEWRESAKRLEKLGDPLSPKDVAKIESIDTHALQLREELSGLFTWNGNFARR
jgi:hypothetical protein